MFTSGCIGGPKEAENNRRASWGVYDYFLLLLCKSSIWFTEKQIFKILIYFFNTLKCVANYVI